MCSGAYQNRSSLGLCTSAAILITPHNRNLGLLPGPGLCMADILHSNHYKSKREDEVPLDGGYPAFSSERRRNANRDVCLPLERNLPACH